VTRLQQHGRLGTRSVDDAATAFHALCEGLAALEIRCAFPAEAAEHLWRDSLTALVDGFNTNPADVARHQPGSSHPAQSTRPWLPSPAGSGSSTGTAASP